MGFDRRSFRAAHPWSYLLALLCVALVAISGTVQVAHTHTDRTAAHPDCSLCAAAHISIHPVHSPAPAPYVMVMGELEVQPPSFLPVTSSAFALFTRPPPVVAVSA